MSANNRLTADAANASADKLSGNVEGRHWRCSQQRGRLTAAKEHKTQERDRENDEVTHEYPALQLRVSAKPLENRVGDTQHYQRKQPR